MGAGGIKQSRTMDAAALKSFPSTLESRQHPQCDSANRLHPITLVPACSVIQQGSDCTQAAWGLEESFVTHLIPCKINASLGCSCSLMNAACSSQSSGACARRCNLVRKGVKCSGLLGHLLSTLACQHVGAQEGHWHLQACCTIPRSQWVVFD